MDAEQQLEEIVNGRYEDAAEAMTMLALAVAELNDEAARDGDRIRKAVERLLEAGRKVAKEVNARGFSIEWSPPLRVAVSFDWDPDEGLALL